MPSVPDNTPAAEPFRATRGHEELQGPGSVTAKGTIRPCCVPAGKKSEFSPSQGPTVALLKIPFRESAVAPVERSSAKALPYAPTMKSGRTAMICCSVGYLRTRVEAQVNLGRPFTGCFTAAHALHLNVAGMAVGLPLPRAAAMSTRWRVPATTCCEDRDLIVGLQRPVAFRSEEGQWYSRSTIVLPQSRVCTNTAIVSRRLCVAGPDRVVHRGGAHHLVLESHGEHELGGALVERHDPLRGPVRVIG